jgi:hypothetical protein
MGWTELLAAGEVGQENAEGDLGQEDVVSVGGKWGPPVGIWQGMGPALVGWPGGDTGEVGWHYRQACCSVHGGRRQRGVC